MLKRLKDKRGFGKEEIAESIAVFIAIVLILTIVFPISNKEKVIVTQVRDKQLKIQEKFSID